MASDRISEISRTKSYFDRILDLSAKLLNINTVGLKVQAGPAKIHPKGEIQQLIFNKLVEKSEKISFVESCANISVFSHIILKNRFCVKISSLHFAINSEEYRTSGDTFSKVCILAKDAHFTLPPFWIVVCKQSNHFESRGKRASN